MLKIDEKNKKKMMKLPSKVKDKKVLKFFVHVGKLKFWGL